ncbi:MAG: hypothetical protein H6706_04580 [Myxococcales bacterium]|nr:hypothetical protein [Myxococcales bacterium]
MRRALFLLAFLASSAQAHELELAAGFLRGEWKADGVVRGLTGLDVAGAWLSGPWRVGLSARMLTSVRDDAGDCDGPCFPARAADARHDPMGALSGGWFGAWGGGQAGVAFLGKDTDETSARLKIRPSLMIQAGPDVLHVAGTLWEPSSWIPAPGRTRLGVGTRLDRFEAWLGVATDETQVLGGAVGIRAALSEQLALNAGVALSPDPAEFLLIRAGLTFVLGGDEPRWPEEAAPPPG